MQDNRTSWQRYNTAYPEPILNQDVQNGEELRLVTMEQKIAAGERIQALIDSTKEHLYAE